MCLINRVMTRELAKITHMHHWNEKLFSLRVPRPPSFKFEAGQFCRIGLQIEGGETVLRPYSIVSSPYEDFLEFYSIVAPGGKLTPLLNTLPVGANIFLETKAHGYLTMGSRFTEGKELWMLSTGTGLAPFVSMLQDPFTFEKYENIYLVHCVREESELAYKQLLEREMFDQEHLAEFANKFKYMPLVTREESPYKNRRITALIEDNTLDINTDSRVMICGNPQMVKDTRAILEEKGLKIGTLKVPGEIIIENAF